MNGKPRGVRWLEEQTGQDLSTTPQPNDDRHVSVRFPGPLAEALASLAAEQHTTISSLIRTLATDAMTKHAELRARSDAELLEEMDRIVHELRGRRGTAA